MKNKSIKYKTILAVLLLNLMLFSVSTVYASEKNVEFSLPVTQTFKLPESLSVKPDMRCTYQLEAASDAPMPEGSTNRIYNFSMDGKDMQTGISFRYAHDGVYNYQLSQTTEDAEHYVYDRTIYTITVYIKNTESGKLTSEVIVQNGTGKKCGEILFQNAYEEENSSVPPSTEHPKTGDDTDITTWIVLSISSLLLAILIFCKFKKHKKKD